MQSESMTVATCPDCGARHDSQTFLEQEQCPTCETPASDLFKLAAGIESGSEPVSEVRRGL